MPETTTAQIEAGAALDAIVFEEVFGGGHDGVWHYRGLVPNGNGQLFPHKYLAYSTTYEGMGLVLERMQALGYEYALGNAAWEGINATFARVADTPHAREHTNHAASLPLAVALAALAAVRA